MSFLGNIFRWLLQDVLVNSLANNRRFQRFALKFDSFLNNNKAKINETAEEISKQAEKVIKENQYKAAAGEGGTASASTAGRGTPNSASAAGNASAANMNRGGGFMTRFMRNLQDEINKDFGGRK